VWVTEAYITGRGATLGGIAAGLVAAGLAGLALLGTVPLGIGLFVVQVVLTLAWLAALDARGAGGALVLVVLSAATADALVAASDEPNIGQATGVIGILFVFSLLFQLARRPRLQVTLSLAATLSGGLFAVAGSAYLALMPEGAGDEVVAAALFGLGAALVVGRLTDVVLPHPAVAPGTVRGLAGVVAGLVAAAGVGWLYGSGAGLIDAGRAVRISLAAAVLAVAADLAIAGVLQAAPPAEQRARSALPPLGILLPIVIPGPAAYVAGRILLG
jgi:hypothetical protein